jgi:ankyrin repeat protein
MFAHQITYLHERSTGMSNSKEFNEKLELEFDYFVKSLLKETYSNARMGEYERVFDALNLLQDDQISRLIDERDIDIYDMELCGLNAVAVNAAAANGRTEILQLLFEKTDVNINAMNQRGDTALSRAAAAGHAKTVEYLLQLDGIEKNPRNDYGGTPLYGAVYNGYLGVIRTLLADDDVEYNTQTNHGESPLSAALTGVYIDIANMLLDKEDIDVSFVDDKGYTALMTALCFIEDIDLIKKILEKDNLDPDVVNEVGNNALMVAAMYNSDEVVELLLNNCDFDLQHKNIDDEDVLDILSRVNKAKTEALQKWSSFGAAIANKSDQVFDTSMGAWYKVNDNDIQSINLMKIDNRKSNVIKLVEDKIRKESSYGQAIEKISNAGFSRFNFIPK